MLDFTYRWLDQNLNFPTSGSSSELEDSSITEKTMDYCKD